MWLHQKCRIITCMYMRNEGKAEDWHALRGADDLPPRRPDVLSGTQDPSVLNSAETKNHLRVACKETEQRLACANITGFDFSLKYRKTFSLEPAFIWSNSPTEGDDLVFILHRSARDLLWKTCARIKGAAEVSAGAPCAESAHPGC